MSESDSDNEYESADETDDFGNEISNSNIIEVEITNLEPNKILKTYEEKCFKFSQSNVPITSLCTDELSEDHKSNMTDDEFTKTQEKQVTKEKAAAKDSVDHNIMEKQETTGVTKLSDGNSLESINSTSEAPPKRVTLRLEKKLQQKNQVPTNSNSNNPPNISKEKMEEKVTSSWSSWGSSLFSSAAMSVSTFTNQVSQGIGTVLETVESSLGAPPPEDLAHILKERRESENKTEQSTENKTKQSTENSTGNNENSNETEENTDDTHGAPISSLFTGVASLTKVIESTGSKVIMGGLDTLELIGKKTMDILSDADPGLIRTRSAFRNEVNLSQLLREIKERADDQSNTVTQEAAIHFSTYFDEFNGLIHLEALEIVSGNCQSKVNESLMIASGDSTLKEDFEQLKTICEDLPSADESTDDKTQDFKQSATEHLQSLQLAVDLQKIHYVQNECHQWLDKCAAEQDNGEKKDAKEIYEQAIRSLAEFTAKCVEQFHKIGELILVRTEADFRSALLCATHLTGLTGVLSIETGIIANKYCQCLNTVADDSEDPDSVTPLITTVYLEASNSTTYIQDAFQLLIPVIQASIIQ